MILITYYWYPWNNPGAFRWLFLSEYLDIDMVITSRKLWKNLFYDETMPLGKAKIIWRLFHLPAVLWGIIITPVLIILSIFKRIDRIIFTCPPESLFIPAWILQTLGKKVYVDVRDKIDRPSQPHKWLIPVYNFFYRKLKNVCVTMQFFDPAKSVIRHGYDEDIVFLKNSIELNLKFSSLFRNRQQQIIQERLSYADYCVRIALGDIVDFNHRIAGYHWTSSSIVTLRKLENEISGKENLHPECFEFEPQSWNEIAKQMDQFLC